MQGSQLGVLIVDDSDAIMMPDDDELNEFICGSAEAIVAFCTAFAPACLMAISAEHDWGAANA